MFPLEPLGLLVLECEVHDPAASVDFLQVATFHFDGYWPAWEIFEVFEKLLTGLATFKDAVYKRLESFV